VSWSNEDLDAALDRYEQECKAAGLTPKCVHSYFDYPKRFLRWRVGDY
jgi:hypothetical protein